MRLDHLLLDEPVAVPDGTQIAACATGLVFHRDFHATSESIMNHWVDQRLRERWLPLPSNARMTMLAQAYPTSLCAMISDGLHAARIELLLSEDEAITSLQVTITPQEPLSGDMLIAAGHDEHWEAALYALADQLTH
ncbi:MAG: hypothetical protein IPJ85_04590 [Flavobacteriales bacterium]|nr:hypothetical protein [Flavobacteriales bacterium]